MALVRRTVPNLVYSLARYLRTHVYTVATQAVVDDPLVETPGTLLAHFPGLVIRRGFPDDLTMLKAPTLALTGALRIAPGLATFGPGIREDLYDLQLYGFVVGQGRDEQNQLYRDRLISDLYALLGGPAHEDGVPLYEQDSKMAIGVIEVSRVQHGLQPANAPEVEAERQRFLMELTVDFSD